MNLRKQWLRAYLVVALSCPALLQATLAAELDAQRQAVTISMFKDDAVLISNALRVGMDASAWWLGRPTMGGQ